MTGQSLTEEQMKMFIRHSAWKNKIKVMICYGLLILFTLPIFLMYLWLLLSSISSDMVYGIIPTGFTLDNWAFLWSSVEVGSSTLPMIWQATWNTILLAGGLTVLEVLISLLASYTLSRMAFPGRMLMLRSIILLHAFPGVALLIAVFYVLDTMQLIDTIWGVLLVKAALQIPMSTYIMKGFFDNVSWDVERSALTDGCSRLSAWYQVVIPQVKPGIAAVSIFSFLAGWSEFLLLYTFIFSDHNILLATYINQLINDFQVTNYGMLGAAGIFYMIPVILFFIFTQKYLMQMNMGGEKGV